MLQTFKNNDSSKAKAGCARHIILRSGFNVSYRWVILSLNGTFVGSRMFCIHHLPCSVSFWCMLGGSVEVWMKNSLYWFIAGQAHLACQEVLKWVWLPMNRNKLLFVQIQTIPPSMHHGWKEIDNILYAKQLIENHRGRTPDEMSLWIEVLTLIIFCFVCKE